MTLRGEDTVDSDSGGKRDGVNYVIGVDVCENRRVLEGDCCKEDAGGEYTRVDADVVFVELVIEFISSEDGYESRRVYESHHHLNNGRTDDRGVSGDNNYSGVGVCRDGYSTDEVICQCKEVDGV